MHLNIYGKCFIIFFVNISPWCVNRWSRVVHLYVSEQDQNQFRQWLFVFHVPLLEPMFAYCPLDILQQITVKSEYGSNHLYALKWISKCHLQYKGHVETTSMCWFHIQPLYKTRHNIAAGNNYRDSQPDRLVYETVRQRPYILDTIHQWYSWKAALLYTNGGLCLWNIK